MLIEILAMTATLLAYPIKATWFDPSPQKAKIEIASGKKVVLLVHGYLHNSSGWHLFRKRLNAAGFLTYTIDLGTPWASIDVTYVKRVQAKIAKIRHETGIQEIMLVGHSMGGIVCCHCAYEDQQISHVVTLGSPLLGTKTPNPGLGECAKQMKASSSFYKKTLQKINSAKERTQFKFFGSDSDLIVRPTISAIPAINQTAFQEYKKLHHFSYLYLQKVANDTISFLSNNGLVNGPTEMRIKDNQHCRF